jgi:HAD superfamily hydrolase (TIGR01509 family)
VIRGVLFDLDGTLADTEPIQWRSYRQVLEPFGVDVGMEEYRVRWIAADGGAQYACERYRLPIDVAELRRRKTVAYRALIAEGVAPCPGTREALERLAPHYRLAIATNSARVEANLVLGHLAIAPWLQAVVAREDYAEAKPAPDAYRAAAAALGLPPADCLVIEDTARGVRSGVAAGCVVVAFATPLTFDNDFSGAAARITSLDELGPSMLRDLSAPR